MNQIMLKTPRLGSLLMVLTLSTFFLSGCVSVNLGSGKPTRSKDVRFQAPNGSFKSISNANADQAWQNENTGNTISFLTECPPPESSLEGMTEEFTGILKSKQIKSTKEDFFNGREALHTWTEGKLDGIPMKVHSLVLKKNGCSFLLTLVGRTKVFDQDQAEFDQFLKSFEAP